MFGSVRGGNYGSVGQSLSKQNQNLYQINAESSPNFSQIANESIKGRSKERRAAIEAESQVQQTGLAEMSKTKQYQIKADTEKEVADIKKPAKRFAGIVGAAGTLAGYGVMKKFSDEQAVRDEEQAAAFDKRIEAIKGAYDREGRPELPDFGPPPTMTMPNLENPDGSVSTPPASNTSGGSNTTPASGSSLKLTPGKPVSQQQGYQLLIDQGMDPENARIGAAVMMAESRGKPKALNNRGEYSLGLWQHNNDTGEDRRAFYGISDWSELEDPVTNARATYRLWKRQGGWTPWGAYTNGSYKNFL